MKKLFNIETLSSRDSVKVIDREIKKVLSENISNNVSIDFSDIVQFTRSFADEILKLQRNYKLQGIDVEFINLNEFTSKMIELVSQKASSTTLFSSINVAASKTVDLFKI